MGIPVLILGESGSGKSASLRNMPPDETILINAVGKPLPFRGKFPFTVNTNNYSKIKTAIKKSTEKFKRCVIDDSQYLLAFDYLSRAKETGYGKFTDLALSFVDLIEYVTNNTPPDYIVYFLHHVEFTEDGRIKAKTIGKMLDEKIGIEGLCTIVLLCKTDGKRHYFVTQSDGRTTAKSPMEMFDSEIDNDLNMVDETIRKYYEFKS